MAAAVRRVDLSVQGVGNRVGGAYPSWVLLNRQTLDGIVRGDVTQAYRRWKRPTVKTGGRLRTVVGELAIDSVEPVTLTALDAEAARCAGFSSVAELKATLEGRAGKLCRIRLRYACADARIELRERATLSPGEIEEVLARLSRMDQRGAGDAWTKRFLELLRERPATRAGDLAASIEMQQKPFKQRVRRLKELGLTESLEIGYRLSPRGEVVLQHIGRQRRR